MDAALTPAQLRLRERYALLFTAFAPLLPQLFGSWFNIWYNLEIINPLLSTQALKDRFQQTVVAYNVVVYPLATLFWVRLVYSLKPVFRALCAGQSVEPAALARVQSRVVNLPWWGTSLTALAWLLCIPVFLTSMATVPHAPDPQLHWHFSISIVVATLISATHSIFAVEVVTYWGLFPILFRDSRAHLAPGRLTLSVRGRGILWAISVGICPIGSLLLLGFAPPAPTTDPRWFAVFVGSLGIVFGIFTALMLSRLVAQPIDQLRAAAQAVAEGNLETRVPTTRPDEFGHLHATFNHMVGELQEKERLRQTFGMHVGRRAAELILARDPGQAGVQEEMTVMFVDLRAFTTRAAALSPQEVVAELNDFMRAMVPIVDEKHGGMINKFLGDGFIALFGADGTPGHAPAAVAAGRSLLQALAELNQRFAALGRAPLQMGIGIHSGRAVVGSIGTPDRQEYTAIGNVVNLASRVQQLTKVLAVPLLLSAETYRLLPAPSGFRALEPQPIRGVEGRMELYTFDAL
jgi:adenylate cyclase